MDDDNAVKDPVQTAAGAADGYRNPAHDTDLRAMALDFALRRTGHDDSNDRVIEYAKKFYAFLTAKV